MYTQITPGLPYAILLAVLLMIALYKSTLRCLEKCLGRDLSSNRTPDDAESLEPFYHALS